jgi:hypothetical protein
MTTKIQLRRDNSSNWTGIDPALAEGEIGFETNTGKFKIGDGTSLWSSLNYFLNGPDQLASDINGNIKIGSYTLSLNSTGAGNAAVGDSALFSNSTGYNNVSFGYISLYSNSSGFQNTAAGSSALRWNSVGSNNAALGNASLFLNGYQSIDPNKSSNNTAAGAYSLYSNTTGLQNTALGYNSGGDITTGSKNVIIGSNTGSTIATLNNNIIISDGDGDISLSFNSSKIPTFPGLNTAGFIKTNSSGVTSIDTNLYLTQSSASTAYQPKDADLTALAGLTSAADALPYFTGSGTASTTTLTTFGRSLIDDADAATSRTTLGLGTMATAATSDYAALSGATFTGRIIPRTGSATASTAPIDFTAGTLLSIPEDGALEYTSDGLYITSNPGTTTTGTGRGLIRAPQIVYSLANSSAATTSTPVSVFAAANDVLSILEPAKLYRFSGKYYLTSTFTTASGETNQILFTFSNAPTAIKYSVKSFVSGVSVSVSAYQSSVATAFAVTGAVTKTESYVIEFDGYFTTNATLTSTLTPQFQMSTTGASTVVTAGSYIEIEKLGTSTQTLIAGNWA